MHIEAFAEYKIKGIEGYLIFFMYSNNILAESIGELDMFLDYFFVSFR